MMRAAAEHPFEEDTTRNSGIRVLRFMGKIFEMKRHFYCLRISMDE